MKFDRFSESLFTEAFASRDRRLFASAFSTHKGKATKDADGKTKEGKTHVDHNARKWVRDVLELFASELHIPHGLAVQAFKMGTPQAIVEHWKRRASTAIPVRYVVDENEKRHAIYAPADHFARKMTKNLDNDNVVNLHGIIRERFSFALGIRAPSEWAREHAAIVALEVKETRKKVA